MSRPRRIGLGTAIVLIAAGCTGPPTPAADARPPVEVQLLALNDFHGNLEPPGGSIGMIDGTPAGGVEYLATELAMLAAETRKENTVTVAAGDLIGASPLLSAAFHDEPAVEALGLAGLDVASVGNHEFDEGADELLRIQNGGCHPTDGCTVPLPPYDGANFQYLAANTVVDATGQPLLPPFTVREVEGVRIGFIGMTLRGTPDIVSESGVRGLSFTDEIETANTYAAELRGQGVETIVVLLHEGGSQTGGGPVDGCTGLTGPIVPINEGLDDAIDVVVSGHTHQAYNCLLDGRIVTSASSFGRVVTDIDLRIDPGTRDVVGATARNIVIGRDVAADPQQTALIAQYRSLLGPVTGRQVGDTPAAVTRDQETLLPEPEPLGESVLGNLVADAQLAATDTEQGAVAAFMNPGGIRADLDAGPITYEEAFAVQPFGNNLVTMDLTGAQLQCLLEQQFAVRRVLQPSAGVAYAVDPAGTTGPAADPCAGTRVPDDTLRIGGAPVDPATPYRITVNSFLADGGDGFTALRDGTNRRVTGVDVDALSQYLSDNQPLAPPATDRIDAAGSVPGGS
jgi:5'-nucleotidase